MADVYAFYVEKEKTASGRFPKNDGVSVSENFVGIN
jgi:hypothetical protein